jgi:hypothetical protein
MQYERVPVDITSNNVANKGSILAPYAGRVLLCDGVFYAQLPVLGQEKPLTIALHGVSSEVEAEQALVALLPDHRRAITPLQSSPEYGN